MTKTKSRIALQYSMWALAAMLSAQFKHLAEGFYQNAKQTLDGANLTYMGQAVTVDVELTQSWILVATYESMRTCYNEAWESAGRAFRLVQLMGFHELDGPGTTTAIDNDAVLTEEKRKAFWMAYFLDYLFCMRNNLPVTITEHAVSLFSPI